MERAAWDLSSIFCPHADSYRAVRGGKERVRVRVRGEPEQRERLTSLGLLTLGTGDRQSIANMNTLLRTALHAPRPAAACTCTRAASSSASKYTLPNGLQLKGTVIAAGRMAQTVSVQVERRMTDHKTLKASTRPSFEIASTTDSADPHTPAQEYSRHTKFLVHDPDSACVVGDQVLVRLPPSPSCLTVCAH